MNLRWLPLLALVACASAPALPIAKPATAAATTVSVPPVAAPEVTIEAPPMPQPPPPPPPKKVLAASERIPLIDVVKAVTPNRRAVVLGPRNQTLLAELRADDFTGDVDAFAGMRPGGVYNENELRPHDVVIVDIDGGQPPVINPSFMVHPDDEPGAVIVRWRHRVHTLLYQDWSYVDSRCHEAVCDAFTIYGKTLPRNAWDFGDLPLVPLDPMGRRQ